MRGESEHPLQESAEPGLNPEQQQKPDESSAVGESELGRQRLITERRRTHQSAQFLDEGGDYVQDEGADKHRLEVSKATIEERRLDRDHTAEVMRQIEGLGFKEGDPIVFTWNSGDLSVRIEHETGSFIEVDEGMLRYIDQNGLEAGTAIDSIRSIQRPFS
jgi:hypothetical protein